jgi:hypothetical protein
VNDPVALKLLDRAKNMPSIEPPEDKSITTLFVGGNMVTEILDTYNFFLYHHHTPVHIDG